MKISDKEFENLFMKYKNDIYRLAYTYVNNQADALDVIQDTAYQAFISKDQLRDASKFKSWVLKIASNKAIDLIRNNKKISFEDISNIRQIEATDKSNLNMFLDDLKSLSNDEKNIVVYKIFFDYTFEMIEEELRMPVSTVKSKYYRALQKLKQEEESYEQQSKENV